MLKYVIQEHAQRLPDGRGVRRIKAVREFGNVKEGTIGGFVEGDDNLSHDGLCWIAGDAMALGRSRVTGDALLKDRARIYDWSMITDRCVVQDDAILKDFVFGYDDAVIGEQSLLAEVVTVRDFARIFCHPRYSVSGKTQIPNVRGNVMICDYARLLGNVSARDDVVIAGRATIKDSARLLEKAYIGDDAMIEGRATVGEEAVILKNSRIGGHTKIFGRVLVAGNVILLGRSHLTCRVRVGGSGTIRNERLSGDIYRKVMG